MISSFGDLCSSEILSCDMFEINHSNFVQSNKLTFQSCEYARVGEKWLRNTSSNNVCFGSEQIFLALRSPCALKCFMPVPCVLGTAG